MTVSLLDQVARVRTEIEDRFSVKLIVKPGFLDSYPNVFETWTLLNVVKAITRDEEGELYGADSQAEKNSLNVIGGDVHPSGKVRRANIELVGIGMAPTLVFSSRRVSTSIWYDKYVGMSDNNSYWPRPDITIRLGAYDIVKSIRFKTSAHTTTFEGGYEVRRGRIDSETVRSWRSLSELMRGNPQLKKYSNELTHNFRIIEDMFSVVSADKKETVAAVGRPLKMQHADDSEYVYGEIESDDGIIPWARKKSFMQPNAIIECKSGLLTPHAVDQLLTYRRLFPASLLIASLTRCPDQAILAMLRAEGICVITPPISLGDNYSDTLTEKLGEVIKVLEKA
jgi:hypothetical protein